MTGRTRDLLQAMIDTHQATINRYQEGIDMMERGDLDIFELEGNGRRTSLKEQTIARDRETISQLQKIVDAAKEANGDRDKFMELLIS